MAVNCDLTNHLWLWPAAARGSIIHSFIHWFVGLKLALLSQFVKVRIKTLALLFLCGNDNKGLPWNNALFKIFALREHSLWSLTNYIFKVYSLSFFFSELYHAWSGWRNRIIPPTSVVLTCLEYRKEKNPKFNEHNHQTSVLCIFNASYLSQKCSLPTLKSRSFAFIFQSWCFGTSGSIDVLK
jgi:hypothetical protein